jgi:hypothetical protein
MEQLQGLRHILQLVFDVSKKKSLWRTPSHLPRSGHARRHSALRRQRTDALGARSANSRVTSPPVLLLERLISPSLSF